MNVPLGQFLDLTRSGIECLALPDADKEFVIANVGCADEADLGRLRRDVRS